MVAVVTELMVGGETPPKMIRQRDPLGLWSLNSDSERCPSNGKDIFVLDNISALIDGYICADPKHSLQRFSLQFDGGPYNFHGLLSARL
jgi:hypothetical protein